MAGYPVTGDQYRDIDRKILELKRQLNQKDGCPQDPEYIKKGLQALIEGRFKAKPRRKIDYVFGMFAPVEIQVENIRKWNIRYGWDFTEGQISRAASSVPAWPMDTRFKALVLVPYLETVQRTFENLWIVASARHAKSRREECLASTPEYMRMRKGIKHPGHCLRWEIINLDGTLSRVENYSRYPHAGVLAVAAQHPRWLRKLASDPGFTPDGEFEISAMGYEIGIIDDPEYSVGHPRLSYHCGEIEIIERDDDCGDEITPTLIPYEGCGY